MTDLSNITVDTDMIRSVGMSSKIYRDISRSDSITVSILIFLMRMSYLY